ncbi:hypothetical protein EON63_14580 [archaeon]|nr:MAG: hypothetical protein EON63_14580 [archaeon]
MSALAARWLERSEHALHVLLVSRWVFVSACVCVFVWCMFLCCAWLCCMYVIIPYSYISHTHN